MGSLQSAILGFGAFRVLQKARVAGFETFTVSEIVIVQTTAVATATMPLAAGMALVSNRLSVSRVASSTSLGTRTECCAACACRSVVHAHGTSSRHLKA